MSKWYEKGGKEGNIVVSSRVRLARNYSDIPFPGRMSPSDGERVIERVKESMLKSAGGGEFSYTGLDGGLKARAMAERHLISPELAVKGAGCGVVLSEDESVSVMINEEDHIRIQVFGAGLCLADCLEKAMRVDRLLEASGPAAFDLRLGYLTSCPTNVGTGMRAGVMLHLPALTRTGAMRGLIAAASKLGMAVRGIYGEGSSAEGELYQISNQRTLGLSEKEIAERITKTVESIIEKETALRARLGQRDRVASEDMAWRAYGLLENARRLSSKEAMRLLSELRLGVEQGIIPGVDAGEINTLLWEIQPAALSERRGFPMDTGERDAYRAETVRGMLGRGITEK